MRQFLILCLFVLGLFAGGQDSFANIPAQPTKDSVEEINKTAPNSIFSRKLVGQGLRECIEDTPFPGYIDQGEWESKYSARFVFCMRMILGETMEVILEDVANYMRPALYSIILLATVIFGMKAVGGMFRNPKVETAMFVVKIGLVLIAYENMAAIGHLFMDTTDLILVMLSKGANATFNVGASGTGTGFSFKKEALNISTYPQYNWIGVYDWMDCLVLKLYDVGTSAEVKAGFVTVAGASFFSSTIGAQAGMMFISFFLALALFLLRVASMLIMSYGAIAMMMLVLPILLLTVFFKATESYFFNRWMSKNISNIVQPAIMMGFLYFALAVLDSVVYNGSTGVYYRYSQTPITTDPNTGISQHTEIRIDPSSSTPPADYELAVEPIHTIFDVDPKASIDEQAKDFKKIIYEDKMFETITIPNNISIYDTIASNCPEGVLNRWIANGLMTVGKKLTPPGAKLLASMMEETEELTKNIDDPDAQSRETAAKIRNNLCSAGMIAGKILDLSIVRNRVEKQLTTLIPDVPKLDFKQVTNQTSSENDDNIQDKRMTKAVMALSTILVLAASLFTYTGNIEQIASTITGRLGMALSVNSPGPGGKTMGKAVGGRLSSVEKRYMKDIKNDDSIFGKTGVKAVTEEFLGPITKR